MLNIDGFAYTNKLRQVHPMEKAAFAFLTMLICLGFSKPLVSFLVLLLMGLAIIGKAGIPARIYLRLMSLPFSFLLIGVLTIAVSVTTQGIGQDWLIGFTVGGISLGISVAGLITAGGLFLKSLGSVSCLYFLALTTPAVELVALMRKLKFPSLFIELTDLTYRFIFVMLDTATDIYLSQSTRWGYSSAKNAMRSMGSLTASLFVKALQRSQNLFTSLTARGYTGQLNVLAPEYTISRTNILVITFIEVALIITAIILEVGKIG